MALSKFQRMQMATALEAAIRNGQADVEGALVGLYRNLDDDPRDIIEIAHKLAGAPEYDEQIDPLNFLSNPGPVARQRDAILETVYGGNNDGSR